MYDNLLYCIFYYILYYIDFNKYDKYYNQIIILIKNKMSIDIFEGLGPFRIFDLYEIDGTDLDLLEISIVGSKDIDSYPNVLLEIIYGTRELNSKYGGNYKHFAEMQGKLACLDVYNELKSLVPSQITGDGTISLFFEYYLEKKLKDTDLFQIISLD